MPLWPCKRNRDRIRNAAPPRRYRGVPEVVAEAQVAAHDVLEEAHGLRLDELVHHVREHRADGVEALVGVADVREAGLVEEDLLHDEDRDGLGELGAGLHDSQAERDDLCRQQEVDDQVVVVLLQWWW